MNFEERLTWVRIAQAKGPNRCFTNIDSEVDWKYPKYIRTDNTTKSTTYNTNHTEERCCCMRLHSRRIKSHGLW